MYQHKHVTPPIHNNPTNSPQTLTEETSYLAELAVQKAGFGRWHDREQAQNMLNKINDLQTEILRRFGKLEQRAKVAEEKAMEHMRGDGDIGL